MKLFAGMESNIRQNHPPLLFPKFCTILSTQNPELERLLQEPRADAKWHVPDPIIQNISQLVCCLYMAAACQLLRLILHSPLACGRGVDGQGPWRRQFTPTFVTITLLSLNFALLVVTHDLLHLLLALLIQARGLAPQPSYRLAPQPPS